MIASMHNDRKSLDIDPNANEADIAQLGLISIQAMYSGLQ